MRQGMMLLQCLFDSAQSYVAESTQTPVHSSINTTNCAFYISGCFLGLNVICCLILYSTIFAQVKFLHYNYCFNVEKICDKTAEE